MDIAKTVEIPGFFRIISLIPTGKSTHVSGSGRYWTSSAIPTRKTPSAPQARTRRPANHSEKASALVDELSHRDDVCLLALVKTGTRLESSRFYVLAPKGLRLYAEANKDHKGINVIGATEILKSYKSYYSIHSSQEGMKSTHVGRFIDKLMRTNRGKEVWVIPNSFRPNKSIASETVRTQLTTNYPTGYAGFP